MSASAVSLEGEGVLVDFPDPRCDRGSCRAYRRTRPVTELPVKCRGFCLD
jgi:hypothetical protein